VVQLIAQPYKHWCQRSVGEKNDWVKRKRGERGGTTPFSSSQIYARSK